MRGDDRDGQRLARRLPVRRHRPRRHLDAAPAFLRYRVLLNHTSPRLTRLDRFRICRLLPDAVEDVRGLSGLDALRRFTDRAS
ncbi:hypothetical protein [Nonomuraea jabiensis]|uniref:hypothetical protein n=1 Tax=Nonomuraea jabiensis TaxID=882448 RepID=UPI0036A4F768